MPDATPVVPASGALATLPDVGDTRRIEWPPESGVYADYTLEELVDRIDQVMLANAGLADYHMSAADVTGALYGMGFGEAAATPVVTLREHPDAADNTVADACEHCGLFSCSGECQDDDGSAA